MPSNPQRWWTVDACVFAALAALTIWLGWAGLTNSAFHNQDVAGITYNADLILSGGVPYQTNLEFKAPGSFFLTALAWTLAGRSIETLQWAACIWSVFGAFGMFVTGRLLYARTSGVWAALLYVIYAANVGSMDANYGVWMATPSIWATAACVWALRSAKARAWLICGVLLAIAGLCKRQAAALFPVFMLVLLVPRLARPDGWAPPIKRMRGALALFGGMVIGFGALGVWYLIQGGAESYIRHYFFSESGWKYAAQSALDFEGKLLRVGDGLLGFWEFTGFPAVLALCVGGIAAVRRRITARGVLLTGHLLMSFAGAAVGFRFFKSYYHQVLPALCWLAAHPESPLMRALSPAFWRLQRTQAAMALVVVIGAGIPGSMKAYSQAKGVERIRSRNTERDLQRVARNILPNIDADDTIWVWGRWAWPLYFHVDKRSATPFYKVLGVVTNTLTNTWRRPTQPTKFVHSPEADRIIADLRAAKPAFIVISKNERYTKWTGFVRLLREEYRKVPHFKMRRFVTYHHKDHRLKKPPRPHRKSKAAKAKAAKAKAAKLKLRQAKAKARTEKALKLRQGKAGKMLLKKAPLKPTKPLSKPAAKPLRKTQP